MNKNLPAQSITSRVLAKLLDYPSDEMRAHLPDLLQALRQERALSPQRLGEVEALIQRLGHADGYTVQARYVETFDRGRATSLHMFEHVHGDSRERGPALVDLQQTYAAGGVFFEASELPDYLPVVLEFVSTQPAGTARQFLGEMAHILNAIHSALIKQDSPYAAAIGAVLELAGEKPQAVQITPDEALDDAWVEPAAFDGCTSKGQSKPGQPQPIHIVKSQANSQGARI
ncbi:nitrate reductase molybdenum cofactor assembly chaperone [Roseateles koreensis]|uniref:Nitrate reductase molybdenum cofactor assembly chaperone n=1 Tax=Roseateles koreensis TaxID=2987526 RepID=A0ABT5KT30_9BURK|nr:nitrate reductase molybdenum cofactor assembly chaperone [Roseateles koreensis]MDC8786074.1 nitrate reductase molybdenum cofactor assembly chaperone [Roseateles koreensis]